MTYYTNKSFNNFRLNFKEIMDLVFQGISLNQISKEYDINRKSLGNYMKDEKLINSLKSKLSEKGVGDEKIKKQDNEINQDTEKFDLVKNMLQQKEQKKNNINQKNNDWEVIKELEKEIKETL